MSNLRASLLRVALAAGLSFALWAFVSFSQNPEASVTFPDLPLEAVGLEPGLLIVDQAGLPSAALPPVDITLRTDRQQLAQLRPVDVRVVADLSGRGPGEHLIPVNVQATRSNLSFTVPDGGTEPAVVPIRLEELSRREVAIDLRVQGNLPFSFERGPTAISFGGEPIEAVEITGPESRVSRVEAARAVANIEQLRATYLAPLTLQAIDAAGVVVEGVTLSPPTVTVEIPINPVVGLKLVPVEPRIVGLPAPGYEITGVLVEPPLIALAGSSGSLDAVELLRTAAVEIGGARENVVRSAQISFPEDTAPRAGEPAAVRVTVLIGPIERPFQAELPVAVSVSGLGPGLQFSLTPQVVSVTLNGTAGSIAGLAQAPLRGTVDLTGLGPGVYQLPVGVDLPPGVSLSGDPPSVQVALRFPPTPTEAAETPTPGATPPAGTPTDAAEPTATPPPPEEPTPTPAAAP
jgi:YbbR domain-containing protein